MLRRTLITGLISLVAAPAVLRIPGIIMPVKAWNGPTFHTEYFSSGGPYGTNCFAHLNGTDILGWGNVAEAEWSAQWLVERGWARA